ncbi:MAG: ABC transporter substrate-binding protein [Verrucomicrobiae bacterium]|nr:ABC transporter substrate-binding protein [Verrucomicrobiae bacterium]
MKKKPFPAKLSGRLAMALAASLALTTMLAKAEPLKIAYNDWPGWVPWEIAIKKGWFKEAGVEVDFQWIDYVKSMETYAAGGLDGCHMTNGDALVTGATGKPAVAILINDYSNGNDMFIAAPGIDSVKDMKGKKVGVEEGFVSHLLVLTALEANGMTEDDVEIVNTPNGETPQVLKSGAVSGIAAWQPSSGQALKLVDGSKTIFTSHDAPGIIYDILYVDPESLEKRRDDWKKVVEVWYKVVDFLKNEDNLDEALEIMAARVNLTADEYEPLLKGTYILTLDEALEKWKKGDGLGSVYGSSKIVDDFNLKYGVYEKPEAIDKYFDPSITEEIAAGK